MHTALDDALKWGHVARNVTDLVKPPRATRYQARTFDGRHPKVVQEILGHSQVSLTMDTYSSVLPSVSREAAEQMDAVLRA